MPRACVIVLDAVEGGESCRMRPTTGDEGSDTLGNVAGPSGGLDLPAPGGVRAREREGTRGLPTATGCARDRRQANRTLEGQGRAGRWG